MTGVKMQRSLLVGQILCLCDEIIFAKTKIVRDRFDRMVGRVASCPAVGDTEDGHWPGALAGGDDGIIVTRPTRSAPG
jgi:hypothetical protein